MASIIRDNGQPGTGLLQIALEPTAAAAAAAAAASSMIVKILLLIPRQF
jgi:hypothetical protein